MIVATHKMGNHTTPLCQAIMTENAPTKVAAATKFPCNLLQATEENPMVSGLGVDVSFPAGHYKTDDVGAPSHVDQQILGSFQAILNNSWPETALPGNNICTFFSKGASVADRVLQDINIVLQDCNTPLRMTWV
jgi:hypothetical protein